MTDLRADAAGREVRGVLYARAIAGPEARAALESEARRYAGIPSYAANFARQGIDPLATTIDLSEPDAVDPFAVVDELVLRVVTSHGTADEMAAVVAGGAALT
jgi:hypothetical protein